MDADPTTDPEGLDVPDDWSERTDDDPAAVAALREERARRRLRQTVRDHAGRWVLGGRDLAEFARENAGAPQVESDVHSSAGNRMPGLVTSVVRDGLMARVEIQAGPFRLVSVMTSEAADELGLEPGVLAVAAVASTNVVVETTRPAR